jgi:hypothetical protein
LFGKNVGELRSLPRYAPVSPCRTGLHLSCMKKLVPRYIYGFRISEHEATDTGY